MAIDKANDIDEMKSWNAMRTGMQAKWWTAEERDEIKQIVVRALMLTAGLLVLSLLSAVWGQTTQTVANSTTTNAATGTMNASTSTVFYTSTPAVQKKNQVKGLITQPSNPASTTLQAYLQRVHAMTAETQPTNGSIWSESGRLTRISTDVRAMRPHDLISVVVSESLAATTDGTVKNSRATAANSNLSALFGAFSSSSAAQNLLNSTSASTLAAQGQSVTNNSLSTTLGGEVVEVLPNGMLVIEAARQVEFNEQTETIVLRGLVRPEDISQQNQILSTAISSLELEVQGKGIINDYTHRQNKLVRFLQSLLVF